MKDYQSNKQQQSRTLNSNPKCSKQLPINVILQKQKEENPIQKSKTAPTKKELVKKFRDKSDQLTGHGRSTHGRDASGKKKKYAKGRASNQAKAIRKGIQQAENASKKREK